VSEHLVLTPAGTSLLQTGCDALILPPAQDGELSGNAAEVDRLPDGLIQEMRERREFRGEAYSAPRTLGKRGLAIAAADVADLPLAPDEAASAWAEGAEPFPVPTGDLPHRREAG
jgi:hypothetical protein